MTVQDLIDDLECYEPDAEVRLLVQPAWPFEHSLAAVRHRSEVDAWEGDPPCFCPGSSDDYEAPEGECPSCDDYDGPPPPGFDAGLQDRGGRPAPANTVFLVEGGQLRYGSKEYFDL